LGADFAAGGASPSSTNWFTEGALGAGIGCRAGCAGGTFLGSGFTLVAGDGSPTGFATGTGRGTGFFAVSADPLRISGTAVPLDPLSCAGAHADTASAASASTIFRGIRLIAKTRIMPY
jgi:hypothetical protein